MLPLSHHSKKEVSALKTLDPGWEVPPTPLPDPPPPPTNANVTNIILTAGGGIILLFDQPVNVDLANPPLTWMFGSAGLQAGGFNFNNGAEVVPNGTVVVGDTAVIGDADPAARTPEGGFVSGTTMGVSAG